VDTFFLHCLVEELEQDIIGLRVNQILQYSRDEFWIKFREKTSPLFISLNSQNPIIFLSPIFHSKTQLSPFSMTLSKYLDRSQVEKFSAIPLERILQFTFKHRNLKGAYERNHLYLELIPKASNAILTDEQNKIIVSFSYPPQRERSYSQRADYLLPEQDNKHNPFKIKQADLALC